MYGILLILTIGDSGGGGGGNDIGGYSGGTSILSRMLSNGFFVNAEIIPQQQSNYDNSTIDTSHFNGNNNNKINNNLNNGPSDNVGNVINKNKYDRKSSIFGGVVAARVIRLNVSAAAAETIHEENNKHISTPSDIDFFHAFIASLSVILVSELGDKTFFIAAIMAMRHPRVIVFTGAISALVLMTILSAVFGMAAQVIPPIYTFYITTALFALFGLKMIRDGYYMSAADVQEELEEVQSDVKKREVGLGIDTNTTLIIPDLESGVAIKSKSQTIAFNLMSRILMQAFTMTFLAEWGDRSQFATIILAARENVLGVIFGGVIGHSLCTGLAVIGGRMIAKRISVRTVTFVGGIVFILFAVSPLFLSTN